MSNSCLWKSAFELENDQWCNWTAVTSLNDRTCDIICLWRPDYHFGNEYSYLYIIDQWSQIIAFIYPYSNPLSQSGNAPFLFWNRFMTTISILNFAIFISHQVFKEACNSSWALAALNGSLFVQKYHSIFLYKTQENSDI